METHEEEVSSEEELPARYTKAGAKKIFSMNGKKMILIFGKIMSVPRCLQEDQVSGEPEVDPVWVSVGVCFFGISKKSTSHVLRHAPSLIQVAFRFVQAKEF